MVLRCVSRTRATETRSEDRYKYLTIMPSAPLSPSRLLPLLHLNLIILSLPIFLSWSKIGDPSSVHNDCSSLAARPWLLVLGCSMLTRGCYPRRVIIYLREKGIPSSLLVEIKRVAISRHNHVPLMASSKTTTLSKSEISTGKTTLLSSMRSWTSPCEKLAPLVQIHGRLLRWPRFAAR
jgi:hypothetical protein